MVGPSGESAVLRVVLNCSVVIVPAIRHCPPRMGIRASAIVRRTKFVPISNAIVSIFLALMDKYVDKHHP